MKYKFTGVDCHTLSLALTILRIASQPQLRITTAALNPGKKQMAEPSEPGRRERQITDAVYALGDATVNRVVESIPDAPTAMAVRRMMHILEEKGHLQRRENGREVVYLPREARTKVGRSAFQNVLETFFRGSLEVLSEKENRRRVTKTIALIALLVGCVVTVPIAMLQAANSQQDEKSENGATNEDAAAAKNAAAEALKNSTSGAEAKVLKAHNSRPQCKELFNETWAAVAAQTEDDVYFVLVYKGFISSGISTFWSTSGLSSKWNYEGGLHLIGTAFGRSVEKRVVAVKYSSLDPSTLYLDGKPYKLDVVPAASGEAGSGEAAPPGRIFLLSDEGDPIRINRVMAMHSEEDLQKISEVVEQQLKPSKPFMPVPEIDQILLSYWQARARTDGRIPGALVASLAKPVEQYAENYPGLKTLASRFDASHDWPQADVVALLDEIVQIAPEGQPLVARFNQYHFSQPAIVRRGQPLPSDLSNVAWGIPLENGLRSAWLIAPDSKEHALGSVLTTRLLIHNAGKEAVVFVLPTHHNPGNAKAGSIQISEIPFTRLFYYAKFRLEPGHHLEVPGFNIALGDKYDKQAIVEAVIQAKAGDEVPLSYTVVATDGVLPYPDSNKDPVAEFQRAIAERVAEEAPMPSSAADRQQLIRRVIRDMFGDTATSEEISGFVADNSPDALVRLTARLQDRKTAQSFVGEIPSGETRIHVVAAESANAGVQNPPPQQPLAPPAAASDDSASVKEPSESPISKMIRGRLLLPDKTPAVGYLVFADDEIDRYKSSRRTPDIPLPDLPQPSKTNENGEFEITLGENRSPGVYYLWVGINNFQVSDDYAPLEVPVAENGHMGDIQFSTGRRITGRVTGLDGKGLANVYVMSRRQNDRKETWSVMRNSRSATTGEDGSFILPPHAAGTFLLHISTTKLGKDELDLAFANQIVKVEDTTPWAVNFQQLLTAHSGNQLNLSPSPKLPIPDTDPLSISIEIRPLETVDITLDVVVDREDPVFGDFEVRISGHLPGMNANDPRRYWTRNDTTKLTTGKFAIAVPRGLTMCNLYAQPIYMRKNDNPVFIWKRPAREVREVASRLELDTISGTVDLALVVQDAVSLSINAEGANEIPGRDVSFEGHAVSPTLGVILFRMFSRDAVDDELFTMQVPECTTARITMMAKGFAPVTEKIANIEPNGRNTIWTYLKPNGLRLTE